MHICSEFSSQTWRGTEEKTCAGCACVLTTKNLACIQQSDQIWLSKRSIWKIIRLLKAWTLLWLFQPPLVSTWNCISKTFSKAHSAYESSEGRDLQLKHPLLNTDLLAGHGAPEDSLVAATGCCIVRWTCWLFSLFPTVGFIWKETVKACTWWKSI